MSKQKFRHHPPICRDLQKISRGVSFLYSIIDFVLDGAKRVSYFEFKISIFLAVVYIDEHLMGSFGLYY